MRSTVFTSTMAYLLSIARIGEAKHGQLPWLDPDPTAPRGSGVDIIRSSSEAFLGTAVYCQSFDLRNPRRAGPYESAKACFDDHRGLRWYEPDPTQGPCSNETFWRWQEEACGTRVYCLRYDEERKVDRPFPALFDDARECFEMHDDPAK